MPTEVITAIISGAVAIIGAILTFIASNKKTRVEQLKRLDAFQSDTRDEISKLQDAFADHKVEMQKSLGEIQTTQKLITMRLNELEKKQDRHNDLVERVYGLETRVTVVEREANK